MAIFGKKNQSQPVADKKQDSSTLDIVKEAMAEKKEPEKAPTDIPMPNLNSGADDLKSVITAFAKEKSQENLNNIMKTLQMPKTLVTIPAQIITSDENKERMKQGGQVKLEGEIKINPMLLTDTQGNKAFPIFSSVEEIPEEIREKSQKVNLPFGHCVNMLKGMKDVSTVALDPYTSNVRIQINIKEETDGK